MSEQKNEFIPVTLPLLTDYALLKTVVEYRHVLSLLSSSKSNSTDHIRSQVVEALVLIEAELVARGIERSHAPQERLTVGLKPTFGVGAMPTE